MGLKENKAIRQLQEGAMPESTEYLKTRHGLDITYDADWDSFSTADQIADLTFQGIERVQRALVKVCADDMGKEALAQELKTVLFKHVAGADKALVLADGTLTVAGAWCAGLGDIFTDTAIQDYIENTL